MAKSASPRPTIAIITDSPAVACTSVLRLPFSLSTLEMAELVVWLMVPGCIAANPKVCADALPLRPRTATEAASNALLNMLTLMTPPLRSLLLRFVRSCYSSDLAARLRSLKYFKAPG